MVTEAQFYASLGAVLMLGPKSASPAFAQPRVRWNYVKLVKAAAAYWHIVRRERAVFGNQWAPRMGVSWAGIARSRVHVAVEKSPLPLEDVRGLRRRAEVSCARLPQAVGCSDLPGSDAGACDGAPMRRVSLFNLLRS